MFALRPKSYLKFVLYLTFPGSFFKIHLEHCDIDLRVHLQYIPADGLDGLKCNGGVVPCPVAGCYGFNLVSSSFLASPRLLRRALWGCMGFHEAA